MAIKDSFLADGGSSHTVPTKLEYCFSEEGGGYTEMHAGTVGAFRRRHDSRPVKVTDVRGHEKEFSLDEQGFAFIPHESKEKDFADDEATKERLYLEACELVKEVTGATSARAFSHIIRHQMFEDTLAACKDMKNEERIQPKVPARFVHIDHSYSGAVKVLEDNFPDEAERERLSKNRWAVINVWHPIHHTVTRDPLAVCDARSVEESDLMGIMINVPAPIVDTVETVTKGKRFELWGVMPNEAHRWYYKSQMQPNETLLIKIFDSKCDGRARRTPHTAFQTPQDDGEARNSIEIRCFVFWEDQSLE